VRLTDTFGRRLFGVGAFALVLTILGVQETPQAATQAVSPAQAPLPKSGAQLYREACAACHGVDGRGRERSVVGFDLALPDFSDCAFAPRKPNADWLAVSHDGGPARGFSTLMPAFGEALSVSDLTAILGHMRTFCTDRAWPRGELNLPRTFFTEKAFPEDETVITVAAATTGPATTSMEFIYEKRFGARNQIELKVPLQSSKGDSGGWSGGAGDIAVGVKRAVFHNFQRGSIFAAAGELSVPTGDETAGLSKRTVVFEPFLSYGQALRWDSFLQAQVGMELPFDTGRAGREAFWRVAVGKSFTQGMFGRSWSPMLEAVAAREFGPDERVNWYAVPQMQITLNTRQHLMMSLGMRIPVGGPRGRPTQAMIYFLWDWFDGGLFDGW
jgi:mono/diheme cytochrome c family protein